MRLSWQTETSRLVCRWSELGERVRYNPRWLQDASRDVHRKNVSGPVVDLPRLSPFGGGHWYAPHPPR